MLVKTFKIVILTLLLLFNCQLIAQGIKACKEGKVSFTISVGNDSIAQRDISVSKFINKYIEKRAKDGFPDISLFIYTQDKDNPLTNFQRIVICYERFDGEHLRKFGEYSKSGNICIYLALFDDHFTVAEKAIKHVVKKYNKFHRKLYKNRAAFLKEMSDYLFVETHDVDAFLNMK